MLTKGFSKTLHLSLIILCILFLAPGLSVGDEVNAAPGGDIWLNGQEWFVSETGSGTDCSRANPGPLEYCVEKKAQSGDTVYVGNGRYEATGVDDELISISKSLRLVGSCKWNTSGPVTCLPQNEPPLTATSYLDGNYQQRVITIKGAGISVSIEGFSIQEGNADYKNPRPIGDIGAGGGIYAVDLDELVLKYNFIFSNRASDSGSMPSHYSSGGGVFAWNIETVDIHENTFIFNSASSPQSTGRGGGLFVSNCGDGGWVNITSNEINGNKVGNTTNSYGAGAYLSSVKNLDLAHNMFTYNSSTPENWIDGSALVLGGASEANSIDHNLFYMNVGSTILDFDGVTGSFSRNTFWGNKASYDVNIKQQNDIKIINNFFGKTYGSSSSVSKELRGTRGGISVLIYLSNTGCDDPAVDIINNTFALAPYAIKVDEFRLVNIARNIFIKHTIKAISVDPNNTHTVVNENLFWHNATNGEMGTNFWVADPKLVNVLNGDLHLKKGSAAIDKVPLGTVTSDIDGQPRPIGTMVDLGADEYGTTFFMPLITR